MPNSKQNNPAGTAAGQTDEREHGQTNSYRRAISESIEFKNHDDHWADRARQEIDRLMQVMPGRFAQINHFGSTAVSGLIAKDSIDLIASLSDWDSVDSVICELQAYGYDYDAAANQGVPGRRWLFRHHNGHRTHHIHLVAQGSTEWSDRIAFCELLKRDKTVRERYAKLKRELAGAHQHDRTAYSNGKSEFIRAALAAISK